MSADKSSHRTRDHATIRRWIEERGGKPAFVKGTENPEEDSGLLRVMFRDEEDLEEVSWDDFFDTFDERGLTFLYQEQTSAGEESRFFKFIREG